MKKATPLLIFDARCIRSDATAQVIIFQSKIFDVFFHDSCNFEQVGKCGLNVFYYVYPIFGPFSFRLPKLVQLLAYQRPIKQPVVGTGTLSEPKMQRSAASETIWVRELIIANAKYELNKLLLKPEYVDSCLNNLIFFLLMRKIKHSKLKTEMKKATSKNAFLAAEQQLENYLNYVSAVAVALCRGIINFRQK